jgi:hypothetical protein
MDQKSALGRFFFAVFLPLFSPWFRFRNPPPCPASVRHVFVRVPGCGAFNYNTGHFCATRAAAQ